MQIDTHLNGKELMDRWRKSAPELYHELSKGLPAQCPSSVGWQTLDIQRLNPFGSDFEKHICLLRFWKRHVELWEMGGPEALAEGTRLRFPSMGDSPNAELTAASAEPAKDSVATLSDSPPPKKKRKMKSYILETRQRFEKYLEMARNHNKGKSFRWIINHRLRKYVRWPDGTVISDGTFYKWKKLYEDKNLF